MVASGVVGWFAGHYHRNAGGIYRDKKGRELEVVVTGAVGTQIIDKPGGDPLGLSGIGTHSIGEDVSGFRVIQVCNNAVEHKWRTLAGLKAARCKAASSTKRGHQLASEDDETALQKS